MEILERSNKILDVLDEIESEVTGEDISIHIFNTIEAFCKVIYVWKHTGNKEGWTIPLEYFTPEEGKVVESRFREFTKTMTKTVTNSSNDTDFANEYMQLQKKLRAVRAQWRELESVLGVVTINTLENDEHSIYRRFFTTLLESLRIWIASSSLHSNTYGILYSFSLTLLDSVRGNIREALISSLGLYGGHGYYISVLLEFILQTIETIAPELSHLTKLDMYKNTNTVGSACLLWVYYTFAPNSITNTIRHSFQEIARIAEEEKKEEKENQLVSYYDIRRLAYVLKNQDTTNLPRFQVVLDPLRSVFILRLILQLLSVNIGPLTSKDLSFHILKNITRKNTIKSKHGRITKTRKIILGLLY